MNVSALFSQQSTRMENNLAKNNSQGQSGFAGLLTTLGTQVNNSLIDSESLGTIREKLTANDEESFESLLTTFLMGDQSSLKALLEKLAENDENVESLQVDNKDELMTILSTFTKTEENAKLLSVLSETDTSDISSEESEQLLALLTKYAIDAEKETTSKNQSASLEQLFHSGSVVELGNQETLLAKLTSLWNQINEALSQAKAAQTPNEASVKILKLLEQWTALEKTAPQEAANLLTQNKDTTEGQLWSRLLQTYQKRADGQMQTKYQSNATVTTTDVSKWIKNAISNLSTDSSKSNTASGSENLNTGQPISKLEQFVVHVKQSNTSDQKAMENKLMEEFQKVIKGSKFMSGPNGSNQLLLKLKPDHLGDVSIKLTQLNGEMIVKITATTQAAKDALESNIQQLRHMFSPQQVVIEKQDAQSFQQAQEEWTGTFDEQMSESSQQNDSDEHENNDGDPDKESLNFEELLMNERV